MLFTGWAVMSSLFQARFVLVRWISAWATEAMRYLVYVDMVRRCHRRRQRRLGRTRVRLVVRTVELAMFVTNMLGVEDVIAEFLYRVAYYITCDSLRNVDVG